MWGRHYIDGIRRSISGPWASYGEDGDVADAIALVGDSCRLIDVHVRIRTTDAMKYATDSLIKDIHRRLKSANSIVGDALVAEFGGDGNIGK